MNEPTIASISVVHSSVLGVTELYALDEKGQMWVTLVHHTTDGVRVDWDQIPAPAPGTVEGGSSVQP